LFNILKCSLSSYFLNENIFLCPLFLNTSNIFLSHCLRSHLFLIENKPWEFFIFYAQVLKVYCKKGGMITDKTFYYFPVDVPKARGLTLGSRKFRKCQQGLTPLTSSLCYCTVILIVPHIPEHFQCSIITVTILFYVSRGAMIIYFCGLTGAALFLVLKLKCRIYSLINWEMPLHRKGRDVCMLIVSSDSLHTSQKTQFVSIIKIKHIKVIKSSRKFSVVFDPF
jgi:hypothetical protein